MARVFAILGPTASGKTEVAVAVAERLNAEVISVDSMQIYREMDIGTAKPSMEERRGVTHHMIDIVDPSEEFTVAQFREQGRHVIESSEVPLIISGGSGLHFRALVDPMTFAPTDPELREQLEMAEADELVRQLVEADPDASNHIDFANRRRVVRALEILELTGVSPSERAVTPEAGELRHYVAEVEFSAVGIDPGGLLEERIQRRLATMIDNGLVEEVSRLWARMGRTARGAVGYREIGAHLDGEMELGQAMAEIARATRRLARRQRTWFQRDPRITWIPWSDDPSEREMMVLEALS